MKVAVVGTGLIGASLGLALSRVPRVEHIAGFDTDPAELADALDIGAIHHGATSAAEAVVDADLVVLAVPTSKIGPVADEIADAMKSQAIVTDVASVKAPVVETLQQAVPGDVHVIGGHPMAGSHERGAAHANPDLFVGATYLLTPTTHTDTEAFRTLHGLVMGVGATPIAVRPDRHDLLVAVVSHLPQLAATTLMNLAAERATAEHAGLLLLAAGGFRDATRVAASNPDMWLDICRENRDAIVEVLDDYRERIGALRSVLATGDQVELARMLTDARAARRGLPGKESVTGALVQLRVPIPDRPGVLADVTTTIGASGVNIEDMGITHAPEGGRGQLRVDIIGAERAATVRDALHAIGYEVLERQP